MIREAVAADAAVLAALERTCFGSAAWSEALVAAEIAAAYRAVLLEERDGACLAYGSISVVADVADLHRVAVLESVRRRGVPRDLLAELSDLAVQRGAERMLLEVAEDNVAAIALYESCGFAAISRRSHYHPGGADSVVMERALA